MRVLVVNAGSQSVKLRVIEGDEMVAASRDLGPPNRGWADDVADFLGTAGVLDAIGHRVVHGGGRLTATTRINKQVRETLASACELAPLHNRPALAAIDAVTYHLPQVPAFACFDTAFHADLPADVVAYAVPSEWVTRWGIRRYGFHGLSCAWATRRAAQLLDRPATDLRLVICHLGGGASVTAVVAGKSVDTTMGFTPLEGLVMATRSGDVDPGALLWVLNHGLSISEAEKALELQSGLLALAGDSDMRALEARRVAGDTEARFAIAVYVHRLRAKVAAMMAACPGADAIIFTGGIGENSAPIRSDTCAGLGWLGAQIDESANAAVAGSDCDVSAPGAPIRTLVVRAREDLQIARECRQALGLLSGAGPD